MIATYGYGLREDGHIGPAGYGYGIGALVDTGLVSASVAALWNVRSFTAQDVELLWRVLVPGLEPVGKAVDAQWAVRDLVDSDVEVDWTVFGITGQTEEFQWSIRQVVGDEAEARWGVRTQAGDEVDTRWGARSLEGDEAGLLWDVRDTVGQESEAQWQVTINVAQDAEFRWDTLSAVTVMEQMILSWATRALTSHDAEFQWNLIGSAARSLAILWRVRQILGQEVGVRWNTKTWEELDVTLVVYRTAASSLTNLADPVSFFLTHDVIRLDLTMAPLEMMVKPQWSSDLRLEMESEL